MKKTTLAAAMLATALGAVVFAQQKPAMTGAANTITVYKTPT
jgi:hypothetical protein